MKQIITDTRVPIKIWTDYVEEESLRQLRNLASMPFIFKHIAAMPDIHAGKGSSVGTVIATKGAIIPSACGVDIGCGMAAVALPFSIDKLGGDEAFRKLRHSIERAVPTGRFSNKDYDEDVHKAWAGLGPLSETAKLNMRDGVYDKSILAIGSLGGGNHFIEICKDEKDMAWIMLHSGSRNIGKCLAEIHIDKAKNLMKEYFISLPDPDLAYLTQNSIEFKEYLHDLMWAQRFAKANREEMLSRVMEQVYRHVYGNDVWPVHASKEHFTVNCHHNYTAIENHFGKNIYVTRKGAVSARSGEFGIIPGSMGTRSYIVRGLGNAESFCSCSHGAGRKMSRTKAKQVFTVEDLIAQTEGVECNKSKNVLDEIPGAYKAIDTVMENQKDLVAPFAVLKQLLCVKGTD